jgi:tetratricopeptide (TPR) repeat protein
VCIVAHYTAVKFLPNLDNIIKSTPTKLTSSAFTDSFALIAGIGGIASLIAGIYFAISAENVELLVYGVFAFIFCEYLMSLSLNPETLGIEITDKTTAGEEFIGILSFVMKGFLRLIPVMFGSGIILGIVRIFDIWLGDVEYINQLVAQVAAVGRISAAAFLPVTGYLAFLLYYFSIDIVASIIAIPQKLDKLQSSNNFVANEDPQSDSGNNTSVSPVEFDELMSKGGGCIQSKDYEEAIDLYTAAIEVNEGSGEAYYMRAIAYSKIKNKSDAIKDIKAAAHLGNEKAIKYLDQKK